MPVKVEGTYIYIAVEGTQADVSAETVRGDIVIKGGSAVVTAKSVEGEVILEGARGRVNVSSVNQGVTVNGATGELSRGNRERAHLAHQHRVDERRGRLGQRQHQVRRFRRGQWRYRFSTHNGNISSGSRRTRARRSSCGPTTATSARTCNCRAAARSARSADDLYARVGKRRVRPGIVRRDDPAAPSRQRGPLKPRSKDKDKTGKHSGGFPVAAVRRRADRRASCAWPPDSGRSCPRPRSRPGDSSAVQPSTAPRTRFLARSGPPPRSARIKKMQTLTKRSRQTSTWRLIGLRRPPGDAGVRR